MKTHKIALFGSQAHALLSAAVKYHEAERESVSLVAMDDNQPLNDLRVWVDGFETTHSVVLNRDGTWCLTTHVEV